MLVANHIKAWKASSAVERLDVRNGLTACPSHDVAFDTGLITVNGGLRIHVQLHLRSAAASNEAIRSVFGSPPLAPKLCLPDGAVKPHEAYLSRHNELVGWSSSPRIASRADDNS